MSKVMIKWCKWWIHMRTNKKLSPLTIMNLKKYLYMPFEQPHQVPKLPLP